MTRAVNKMHIYLVALLIKSSYTVAELREFQMFYLDLKFLFRSIILKGLLHYIRMSVVEPYIFIGLGFKLC